MPVVPAVATDRYYLNQEIGDYLRIAEEAAPHLVRLYTIGTSYEGRPLLMAEITNRAAGEGHEKPAIWLDGGWRGGQLLGSSACLEVVRLLTGLYGRDPIISDLLDHVTFYVCPRLAADAGDLSLITGEWCWSSTRPGPMALPGLRPGDANGDGRSLQMRVVDPLGGWKMSKRDARLMVPRAPDDRQGPFYRLLPEGLCDDAAARVPTGPRSQLDLERNFPSSGTWEPSLMGPYPFSEPETRAVADFFRTHANLGVAISFGNLGGGIAYPEPLPGDASMMNRLAVRLREWTGLPVQANAAEGFLNWAYRQQKILVLRSDPWSLARAAGLDRGELERTLDEPELATILRWLDRDCPGAFHPWTAFDHPQLGTVELGGWEWLYSWLNPPPGPLLQAELDRFAKLVVGMAQSLPRLAVRQFVEEQVGWSEFQPPELHSGEFVPLRKVSAIVENRGYLPTWVCQSELAEQQLELHLLLEGGQRLILGKERVIAGQLSGVGLLEGESHVPYISGVGQPPQYEYEWLVSGAGRLHLEARHVRGGVCHQQVSSEPMVASEIPLAPAAYSPPLPAPPPLPPPPPTPPPRPTGRPTGSLPPPPATPPPAVVPPAAAPRPVAPAAVPPARPPVPPARPQMPAASGRSGSLPPPPGSLPAPPPAPAAHAAAHAPPPVAPPQTPVLKQLPPTEAAPPAPAEQRGRVLGSPPPKPGAPVSSYAARAQELIQAQRSQETPPRAQEGLARPPASDGFEPFSPGLPMKSARVPSSGTGRPIESPPSLDFDEFPPEHPPVESKLPPMFLRNRERGK